MPEQGRFRKSALSSRIYAAEARLHHATKSRPSRNCIVVHVDHRIGVLREYRSSRFLALEASLSKPFLAFPFLLLSKLLSRSGSERRSKGDSLRVPFS